MRRGFKAEAERIADQMRTELHTNSSEALRSETLAAHLGLEVRSAGDLIDVAKLQLLEELQPGAFSACTFEIGPRRIIVWNPLSTPARTQSDIAHEVAHVLLKHEVKRIERISSFTFYSCDPDEEQEANWLAGCLLLPRALLVRITRVTTDPEHLAHRLGLSQEMVTYRLRATGVLRQTSYRRPA